jgi:hypothetical protein
MSDVESSNRKSSVGKEEKKQFDMKKMPFYNPELLSKRKVIINTSTSKEMYSFPTTKRFDTNARDDSSFFYNIPSSFNKRSTSFGFGAKLTFRDQYQYPGPGAYNHLGINKKGRYAVSEMPNSQQNKFGNETRFKNQVAITETPGPSSYSPERMIKGNGIIYNSRYATNLGKSMGQRLGKIGEKIITPGPGSYDYMNINKKGRYPSSLLKNSILNKFGNEIRFRKLERNDNPAPNNYYPESMIKGNGIIYNSRYYTSLGKTMGARLNELSKSATPGPGAYEFFSDFEGFYKYGKSTKKDNNSKENNTSEDKKETGDSQGGRSSDNTGGNSSEQ